MTYVQLIATLATTLHATRTVDDRKRGQHYNRDDHDFLIKADVETAIKIVQEAERRAKAHLVGG